MDISERCHLPGMSDAMSYFNIFLPEMRDVKVKAIYSFSPSFHDYGK